jgi:hypothetical protein
MIRQLQQGVDCDPEFDFWEYYQRRGVHLTISRPLVLEAEAMGVLRAGVGVEPGTGRAACTGGPRRSFRPRR